MAPFYTPILLSTYCGGANTSLSCLLAPQSTRNSCHAHRLSKQIFCTRTPLSRRRSTSSSVWYSRPIRISWTSSVLAATSCKSQPTLKWQSGKLLSNFQISSCSLTFFLFLFSLRIVYLIVVDVRSTTVFSHAQTVVVCGDCTMILCQPTGGKARLTEGCSFRKKVD